MDNKWHPFGEDDFARMAMKRKHKQRSRPVSKIKHPFKSEDEKNIDKCLAEWDDLVIDELKINN